MPFAPLKATLILEMTWMNVSEFEMRFCAAPFTSDRVTPVKVGLTFPGTLAVNVVDCVPVLVEPE